MRSRCLFSSACHKQEQHSPGEISPWGKYIVSKALGTEMDFKWSARHNGFIKEKVVNLRLYAFYLANWWLLLREEVTSFITIINWALLHKRVCFSYPFPGSWAIFLIKFLFWIEGICLGFAACWSLTNHFHGIQLKWSYRDRAVLHY